MNRFFRIAIGVVLLLLTAGGAIKLAHDGLYGLTMFTVLPVVVGAIGSWSIRPRNGCSAAFAGALTVAIGSFGLLGVGVEGLICIVMALPLAAPLGALGGYLAYCATSSSVVTGGSVAMLFVLPPASLTFDTHARPAIFEVRSAITIDAPPEAVWKDVVTFSDLPEPQEWYFRAGLAYPERARIEGTGVGAVRYCEFSTGPFVEPVEVWNEPRLLRFRVVQNPAPLHEWSPYARVLPKHLHGYMISKGGQFRLTPLEGGRTLLEGTTWYQHGLWPAQYWSWWSGAIIHRIHLRVLDHIRTLAEADSAGRGR